MSEYIWEILPQNQQLIQALMEAAGVGRPAALVLAQRGIAADTAELFLNPTLQQLRNPYELSGTEKAAARLWRAIHNGERIMVHGDYDTDGITAAVLVCSVLRENGANVTCFLPHRIDDGYGLTPESIEKAMQDDYNLLLTVDCGITNYDALERARQLSLDLIITDHHEPGPEEVMADAVVDPKLPGSDPAIHDLAGVGVAFKVCHAFLKYGREHGFGGDQTDLRRELDLVALGTVADIVPLMHENRLLVNYGLGILSKRQRPGIHALCEIAQVSGTLKTSDITYKLAPRLNAAGRMGDANDSLKLLEASSMVDAFNWAQKLETHNQKRQQIEEEAILAAEEQIKQRYDLQKNRTLIVWDEHWHQGVLGIVASRLVRRHNRPSIVLTSDGDGHYCGSGRSVGRLNLVSLMECCKTYLQRYGGHALAAGLSVKRENLEAFCEFFEQTVCRMHGLDAMRPQIDICGAIRFNEVDERLFADFAALEPFGHGNPEPVFVSYNVSPEYVTKAGKCHTRGVLRDAYGQTLKFIIFQRMPDSLPPPPWDIAYNAQLNHYAGRSTPQARLVDIKAAQ